MNRILEALKLLIIGVKNYEDETIYFHKIDDKNEYIKECFDKPIIKYKYERTHIGDYYCVEMNHKFINLSYILSKIDCNDKKVELNINGINRIKFNDEKIDIAIQNYNMFFMFYEKEYNRYSFDEKDDFYGKEEVVSFFNLIKEEIEKDINKLIRKSGNE